MRIGQFDSDAEALKKRIQSNERFGSSDLNSWIFAQLDAHAGMKVLDLGCGTGKQSLALAQIVGERGHVTALDISAQALAELQKRADDSGVSDRIETICISLDDFAEMSAPPTFHRVVSSYALYYARHPASVVRNVFQRLEDGGVMFICGPAKDNNAELIAFQSRLNGHSIPATSAPARIMEDDLASWVRDIFGGSTTSRFENRIAFDSADALHEYWTSHNLFDAQLDRRFMAAAEEHFRSSGQFENVKRAIGVRAVKKQA